MNESPVTQPHKLDLLNRVQEGMAVFDAGGKRIGQVAGLHLGAAADTTDTGVAPETSDSTAPNRDAVPGIVPVPGVVAMPGAMGMSGGTGTSGVMAVPGVMPEAGSDEPNDMDDKLPDVLRKRLEYNGYVRIDAGALHRDRYALREQVASVSSDGVHLNVAEDALIKA